MSELIMKAAGIKKGSNNALKNKVAKLSKEKVLEIVKQKIADLNTKDVDQAVKIVEGQCRSIGVDVEK
jgi:large subunit ribosomal protein L11